jgi:hypothetical protein
MIALYDLLPKHAGYTRVECRTRNETEYELRVTEYLKVTDLGLLCFPVETEENHRQPQTLWPVV